MKLPYFNMEHIVIYNIFSLDFPSLFYFILSLICNVSCRSHTMKLSQFQLNKGLF